MHIGSDQYLLPSSQHAPTEHADDIANHHCLIQDETGLLGILIFHGKVDRPEEHREEELGGQRPMETGLLRRQQLLGASFTNRRSRTTAGHGPYNNSSQLCAEA